MKRLSVLLCLMLAGVLLMGQNNKVQSAFNYMKPSYNELDKAKEAIDAAARHPKTQGKAKTWYYRGECYHKIFMSRDDKFKDLDPNPLRESYLSYVKAKSLDEKRSYDNIEYRLVMIGTEFFNKGSVEFEQKMFKESLKSFETVLEIGQLPYINQVDTGAFYSAAIAADQAGLYDKALEYYNISIELKYMGSDLYHYVAVIYMAKGDTVKAVQSYEDGIKAYPESNGYLYIQLINHYLVSNNLAKAAEFIIPAVEQDPDNASLWNVYGRAFQDIDEKKEVAGYERAIELDSTFFDPSYNLGTIYYNHGVDANELAMSIPLDDKEGFEAAITKRDQFFNLALPYFEKAVEIDNLSGDLLKALKEIYYRFQMKDKLEGVTKLMEARK